MTTLDRPTDTSITNGLKIVSYGVNKESNAPLNSCKVLAGVTF